MTTKKVDFGREHATPIPTGYQWLKVSMRPLADGAVRLEIYLRRESRDGGPRSRNMLEVDLDREMAQHIGAALLNGGVAAEESEERQMAW